MSDPPHTHGSLHTDSEKGIQPAYDRRDVAAEVAHRQQVGVTTNATEDKGCFTKNELPEGELATYCELIMEGLEDFVMQLLMASAGVQLILGLIFHNCGHGVAEVSSANPCSLCP